MYKLLVLFSLFTLNPAQASAGEIATLFIGAGPSIDMSAHPKVTFLKSPDGSTDLGIYYEISDRGGTVHNELQVRDCTLIPQALAAMLYQHFINLIQVKTGHLGGVMNEDTLYLANKLLENAGPSPKVIHSLPECREVMAYLRDLSSTVYEAADLAAIQPFLCDH